MSTTERRRTGAAAAAATGVLLVLACSGGHRGGGGGGDGDGGGTEAANEELQSGVILPDEGDPLESPASDESIDVGGEAPGTADVHPGDLLTVNIPFVAPDGNVIGAGIRFGDTGSIRVVQVPDALGLTAGTLTFQFQVPPSICGSLSSICHAILCYEFAVTSAGLVSRANINQLALACGACDEPSCQGLLDECESGDCPTAEECGGYGRGGQCCYEGTECATCLEACRAEEGACQDACEPCTCCIYDCQHAADDCSDACEAGPGGC